MGDLRAYSVEHNQAYRAAHHHKIDDRPDGPGRSYPSPDIAPRAPGSARKWGLFTSKAQPSADRSSP